MSIFSVKAIYLKHLLEDATGNKSTKTVCASLLDVKCEYNSTVSASDYHKPVSQTVFFFIFICIS